MSDKTFREIRREFRENKKNFERALNNCPNDPRFLKLMDEKRKAFDEKEKELEIESKYRYIESKQVCQFYENLMSGYVKKIKTLTVDNLLKIYSLLKSEYWPPQLGVPPLAINHHLFWEKVRLYILPFIEEYVGIKAIKRYEKPIEMTDQQFEDWWDSYVFNQLKMRR